MKSRVMNVSSGIASQIKKKYSLIPEFTEAPPSIDKQEIQDDADYSASGPRSKDWIYILVILCVTIAVGLLMVIVTVLYYNCCYTKTVDLQVRNIDCFYHPMITTTMCFLFVGIEFPRMTYHEIVSR